MFAEQYKVTGPGPAALLTTWNLHQIKTSCVTATVDSFLELSCVGVVGFITQQHSTGRNYTAKDTFESAK